MPTAPSPEAPTVIKTAPKLSVPSLAELTGTPKPPVPVPKGPEAPPKDLNDVLGKPPGSEPIIPPIPAGSEDDDDEPIDTSIMPARPGAPAREKGGKSAADFAKERQESKTRKLTVEEAIKLRDEAIADSAKIRLESENERKERDKYKTELEEFKALAGTRAKDIDDLNGKYFDNFKPTYDIGSDQEIVQAHNGMFKALEDNMPAHIGTRDGKKRVMFEQIARSPQSATTIENAMLHYAAAKQQGDDEVMNAAVTTVAGVLANDPTQTFFGRGDPRNRLLTNEDPDFLQIETAMVRALPSLKTKADRAAFIRENEPKLAEERFTTRTRAINSDLNSAFTQAPDQIANTLKTDPTNSIAIFSAILNHAPHLRETVNASIAKTSEALSSIPDNLLMPPLKSNDKVAVAAHRKLYNDRKNELSELARFAIIGKNCGAIIADLIASRDDAEERAQAAANNTNPGASRSGDGKPPEQDEEIPTTIMPPAPR